jgi:hypothetical protein
MYLENKMWNKTVLKPLPGHISKETAYVVDD